MMNLPNSEPNAETKYQSNIRRWCIRVAPAASLVRRRRKFKSAAFFFCLLGLAFVPDSQAFSTRVRSHHQPNKKLCERRHEWVERSVQYYSTVMRKNKKGRLDSTFSADATTSHEDKTFVRLATEHYYARYLIKVGKFSHAESIYRRIIDELTSEEDGCDHTKLAVSTLLLALHMQRSADVKKTRAVFLDFFARVAQSEDGADADECTCSAKVLQAYALFEMKHGQRRKSLEIIKLAVRMDPDLKPVLKWKQFRDTAEGREYTPTVSFKKKWIRNKKVSAARHDKERDGLSR